MWLGGAPSPLVGEGIRTSGSFWSDLEFSIGGQPFYSPRCVATIRSIVAPGATVSPICPHRRFYQISDFFERSLKLRAHFPIKSFVACSQMVVMGKFKKFDERLVQC